MHLLRSRLYRRLFGQVRIAASGRPCALPAILVRRRCRSQFGDGSMFDSNGANTSWPRIPWTQSRSRSALGSIAIGTSLNGQVLLAVSFPDRLIVERRLLWSKERSCGSRGSVRPKSLASCEMPRAACPCRTCDGRTASARRHSSSGGASTGARRGRMCDNCGSSRLNTPSSSGCTRTWRWSTRPSRMSCTEHCRAVREATAGGGAGTGASVARAASRSRGEAGADGVRPASGAGESPGCRGNCGADGRRGALSAVGLLEAP